MGRPIAKTKIKDYEYTITLIGASAAFEGFGVLASYLGGPLGQALGMALAKDKAPDLLAAAMGEIGKAMRERDFQALVWQLLEGVTVQAKGQPPVALITGGDRSPFDDHFRGELGAQVALVVFALKENFANFLDGLPIGKRLLEAARAKGQAQLSQLGSTG